MPRKTPMKRSKLSYSPQKPPCSPIYSKCPKSKKRLFTRTTSTPKPTQKGCLAAITTAVASSKYYSAFRHILSRGKSASKAFHKLVQEMAKNEIKRYAKGRRIYPVLAGRKSVEDFSWSHLTADFKSHMPTVTASLLGAMQITEHER